MSMNCVCTVYAWTRNWRQPVLSKAWHYEDLEIQPVPHGTIWRAENVSPSPGAWVFPLTGSVDWGYRNIIFSSQRGRSGVTYSLRRLNLLALVERQQRTRVKSDSRCWYIYESLICSPMPYLERRDQLSIALNVPLSTSTLNLLPSMEEGIESWGAGWVFLAIPGWVEW